MYRLCLAVCRFLLAPPPRRPPRPLGGPRKSARTYNGLAAATRTSSLGLGSKGTVHLAGEKLILRTACGGGGCILFEPIAKEFIARSAGRKHHRSRDH